jgi:putative mRNA 3-end processing factor
VQPTIQIRDGIEIHLSSGERVVADASAPNGDISVVSHAHGDHLYNTPPAEVICSETTRALAAERRSDKAEPAITSDPRITLHNAGHVPGSRATLIEDDGTRILYTGDLSIRDRFYLDGFEPMSADILIIEATYGKPEYDLPPQETVHRDILSLLNESYDTPIIAFGYTLGRGQELIQLGMQSDRETVYTTEAIDRINDVIETTCDVTFDTTRYSKDVTIGAGDFLVLPGQTNNLSFVDDIVDETGAILVGASGWAVDTSFKYRGGFDETFALSDHCDFSELLSVVETVDPDRVYTNHGFAEEFATEVRKRLGIESRALKRNQTTLEDY